MERTKTNEKADLILTSDWHLREDNPTCRTDDFESAQWRKVDYIADLQRKHACPVVHAGDLFHHWKPSPYLLSQTIKHIPAEFFTVYGQHDLPQHSLELADKCGINVLKAAEKLGVLPGVHYGRTPEQLMEDAFCTQSIIHFATDQTILVWHHLTYIAPPFPGATGGNATGILKLYPRYALIVTGDNHQSFTVAHEGRLLVNPGSLTRQTADQVDFKPRVYLWFAKTNTVIPAYLPIEEGVISREHIEITEERDARIDAFISKLNGEWDVSLSFEQNLEEFRQQNNISSEIMDIIYRAMETVKTT